VRRRTSLLGVLALLGATLVGVVFSTVGARPAHATGSAGAFVPVQGRLLDTRTTTPMTPSAWLSVPVAGVTLATAPAVTVPSSGVTAVSISVTVFANSTSGAVALAADDATSKANAVPGTYYGLPTGSTADISNSAMVAVSNGGAIAVRVDTAVNVAIDLQGYYTSSGTQPAGYVPVAQNRVLDSRAPGVSGHYAPGSTTTFTVPSTVVPAQATAVFANITVQSYSASDQGSISAYAAGDPNPGTSMAYRANALTALGTVINLKDGTGQFTIQVGGTGSAMDLIIDISGYFNSSASNGQFTPLVDRVWDSRLATPVSLPANTTRTVQVAGIDQVPAMTAGIGAVAVEITVVESAGNNTAGFVTTWPSDYVQPAVSNVNFDATTGFIIRGNLAIVGLGADGAIKVYNGSTATIDIVLDVQGWFQASPPPPSTATQTPTPAQPAPQAGSTPAPSVPGTPGTNANQASTARTAIPSGTTATSGTGSWGATPLAPASTWQTSAQSGSFSWSYGFTAAPAAAGPTPSIGLAYDSGSVDGETSASNNQSSVVGDGWALSGVGSIDRSYVPCPSDHNGTGPATGDLCWSSENASLGMAGHSGPIVRDSTTGVWHLSNDDGSTVTYVDPTSGGSRAGDYWKIITPDGTQYFYGQNANGNSSRWTVPVFGNDTGEPCHQATYAASSCPQAWRWNLDLVIDPHGNKEAFYYSTETNQYTTNNGGTGATTPTYE
jgi:hypothetical protein